MPIPKGLAYGELQDFKATKQKPIRLRYDAQILVQTPFRVINFLKNWLEKSWKDFTTEPEMVTKLQEFLVGDLVNSGNQTSADQLGKLLLKKVGTDHNIFSYSSPERRAGNSKGLRI